MKISIMILQEYQRIATCVCLLLVGASPILSQQTIIADNVSLYGDFSKDVTNIEGDTRVHILTRALYNETSISMVIRNCTGSGTYEIQWMIRYTECFNNDDALPQEFYSNPSFSLRDEDRFWYYKSLRNVTQTCGNNILPLADESNESWIAVPSLLSSGGTTSTNSQLEGNDNDQVGATRLKVTETIQDGNFILIVYVSNQSKDLQKVDIEIVLQSERGFPSKYPDSVLLFYGLICCVYVLQIVLWFLLVACNWKNILRIHHMMNVVLLVSIAESVFDLVHHEMLNKWLDVDNNVHAVILDIITVLQTSVCLFFMMLFSLGDGITKPKLGRCSIACSSLIMVIFFFNASCLILYMHFDSSNKVGILTLAILVALYGFVLIIWIGNNLVKTTKQLHKQNKIAKMIVYICVILGLVFYFLANVISLALYFKQISTCAHVWEVLVSEGAFLPVTMSAFLLFVMILIRPTLSNLSFLRYDVIRDKSLESDDDDDDDENNVFVRRHKLETVV